MNLEEPTRPSPTRDRRAPRRATIAASAFGALLIGGAAVAASLAGATSVAARSGASPAPAASTTPGGTNGTVSGTTSTQPDQGGQRGPGGHGGLGANHETVTDTSVAATAIGISESDLTTALASGQSMAAVAKAHNVDPQKVIDALLADAQSEIAAAVTAGTLTQAQADAEKANVTARVTDQVNGTRPAGGPGGPGGRGGHAGHGNGTNGAAPSGAPSL